MQPIDELSRGKRILFALIILVLTILILMALSRLIGSDEAKAQPGAEPNPFTICQVLQGGIQSKEAMLEAWKIMLMVHLGKTADNVVAFPAMEDVQLKTFETGLRRAIIVDAKVRAIIDKVYAEQGK